MHIIKGNRNEKNTHKQRDIEMHKLKKRGIIMKNNTNKGVSWWKKTCKQRGDMIHACKQKDEKKSPWNEYLKKGVDIMH